MTTPTTPTTPPTSTSPTSPTSHSSHPPLAPPQPPLALPPSPSQSPQPPQSPSTPTAPAPPQPPLPAEPQDQPPPIVDGIEPAAVDLSNSVNPPPAMSPPPAASPPDDPDSSDTLQDNHSSVDSTQVRPGDLAALSQLFSRFHARIEKAASGRKYRPLREAWDAAATEIARDTNRIRLAHASKLVVDALRLGCESGKIVLVDACLDCVHRLFEYGHVGSDGHHTDIALDAPDPAILDSLINIVCDCLEVKDEDVFLRMVQTLLTAATRTKSGLHQSTLLAAVRTIYNIFLNARMPGTRTTARVSLTQILNLVFTRMETETAEDSTTIASFSSPAREPSLDEDDDRHDQPRHGPNAHHADTTAVTVSAPATPAEEGGDPDGAHASTVLQKDAFLLFRALCKLSAKEVVDINSPDAVAIRSKLLSLELIRNLIKNSGPAFRSGERFVYALRQYLARSLLINCMWNSIEVMDVSFDIFEMLLRKDTLRPLLKNEIGTLFDAVVFRFLESPTAGPMRKRRAVTLLSRLSADRQAMADLFLNYDCDMESPKIFEHIVSVISTAACDKNAPPLDSGLAAATPGAGQVDARVMALTSIVQVVRSLREWSKPIEDSKEQTRLNDVSPRNAANGVTDETDTATRRDSEDRSVSPTRLPGMNGLAIGVVSEGSDRDTSRFEEALKAKRDTAEGVTLFNTKPKKGIAFLIAQRRLKEDAVEIARFLHKAEHLDAAMIGEYLGESGQFNVSVMHAYTDMNDFTNLTFDGALRLHLSGFRLPGEAQKIDRIMEKFASRFCECNPEIFANADAAYVLAYSTIMLHTDAHNDTIKNKMSKEEFIRNNRGINDGGDLDPVFLGKLYDRIVATEINLAPNKKDSTPGADKKSLDAAAAAAAMDPVQRAQQFEKESERLMAQTKFMFAKKRKPTDYTYFSATNVHHARLMFDTAWYPVLAAVSLNLEEASSSDSNVVTLCLDGFRHGIAISSTFSMTTAKDAFVSSLAKFTHLNSISEMRSKNVECVRMILAIAAMEGNNLGEQWVVIVKAISLLEQIRAVASGNPEKYLLQKSPLKGIGSSPSSGSSDSKSSSSKSVMSPQNEALSSSETSSRGSDSFRRRSTTRSSASQGGVTRSDSGPVYRIDQKAAKLASTIAESEIERIFTNSSQLSAAGVADFCGALCTASLEELSETPTARLFCLQKIVEMAYYNMDSRTRIQWGKIWDQMGPFFASAMCHSNRDVAMYSVDALRQLASKFLDKDELSNFSFQRSFLKPFEMCFVRSNSIPIRELVLSCISQIVLARASNIKSGWKSVFAVLALAADDEAKDIMNFGWQIVGSIARKYIGVLDDVYVDAVAGISAYAKARLSADVALAAIDLLKGRCAGALSDGVAISSLREPRDPDRSPNSLSRDDVIIFNADNDIHIGAWFPLLTGLASAMQDEREAIRMAANEALYKVLTDHGGRFSPSLWALIFRGVLSPIFDDVRHLSASNDRSEAAAVGEWATTTGSASLRCLVDVFVLHIKVTRGILEDLLELVRSWILQESESVAREGMSILARLIMSAGEVLGPDDWKIVVNGLNRIFIDTMPHEILESEGRTSGTEGEMIDGDGDGILEVNSIEEIKKVKHDLFIDSTDSQYDNEGMTANGVDEDQASDEAGKGQGKIDFRVVRAKCVVQLLLIELVQEVVVSYYRLLSTEDILSMCSSLEESYNFAHNFNADIDLRYSLWRTGFMNQVPNLLKQETNGLMSLLRILFWLYLDNERQSKNGNVEAKVMDLCSNVLRRYIQSCQEAPSKSEERREVAALSPVVSFIVKSMVQMLDEQFKTHLKELYDILLSLLENADDREVRTTVTGLFRARIKASVATAEDYKDGKELVVGSPELPRQATERIVRTELDEESGAGASTEICAALNKVGGVRSVSICEDRESVFEVITCAPDEMLVAGVRALPFVRAAHVEAVAALTSNDELD